MIDENGRVLSLKDKGEKRKLCPRVKNIVHAVAQVRQFRAYCMKNSISMTNLGSTYVLHSRFERAEVLQPNWAASCVTRNLSSGDADEEAKWIISTHDTPEMQERLKLGKRVRRMDRKGNAEKKKCVRLDPGVTSSCLSASSSSTLAEAPSTSSESYVPQPIAQWTILTPSPVCPVQWKGLNLCQLRQLGEETLNAQMTMWNMKGFLAHLNLNVLPSQKKEYYLFQVLNYLKHCPCTVSRITHTHPPPYSSTFLQPTLQPTSLSFKSGSSSSGMVAGVIHPVLLELQRPPE